MAKYTPRKVKEGTETLETTVIDGSKRKREISFLNWSDYLSRARYPRLFHAIILGSKQENAQSALRNRSPGEKLSIALWRFSGESVRAKGPCL